MAELNTPISNLGSQTQPAAQAVTFDAAGAKTVLNGQPTSFAFLPSLRAVAGANGVDRMRIDIGLTTFELGLLPPDPNSADPAAASSGTNASATLECASYTIANDDALDGFVSDGLTVWFTSNFNLVVANANRIFIKRESTTTATLDHLEAFVDGTGVEGVGWSHGVGGDQGASDHIATIRDRVEVTSKDANTLVLTAKDAGSAANGWPASLGTGTWTGSSFGSSDLFSGGADGTPPGPGPGTYRYAYSYYRNEDLAESGLSDTTSISLLGEGEVDLSSLVDGPDLDYGFKRIYRTLVSGVEFFRVADVADGTTTYTDTATDEDLVAFGSIPFDVGAHRGYYSGIPPKYRVLAQFKGRLWGGGAIVSAKYTSGKVVATNDSATISRDATLIPVFNHKMVGRRFRVTDNADSETYRIISVDESAQTLLLDRPYQAATKDPAAYEIVDDRGVTNIGASEPGLPNQWPEINQLTGISSQDAEGIVGVVAFGDFLFWFTRDGIWRLTGDGLSSWQLTQVVEGVGSIMQPITVPGGMIWVGVDGVYLWSGSGQPTRISSPTNQGDRVTGIDGTIERISEAHATKSHGVYDPNERVVRFFLPLDGAAAPSHTLVLELASSGTFSLDNSPGITASGMVTGANGEKVMLLGDQNGKIWHAGTAHGTAVDYHFASAKDQDALAIPTKDALEGDFTDADGSTRFRVQKRGNLHQMKIAAFVSGDGGFGFEPVQAVVSATANTITVAATPFPTAGDGLDGVPVIVVRDTGTVEYAKIASNTSSVLTLTTDLTYTPDSNDQIVVGGIFMDLVTGKFDFGETRRPKSLNDVYVTHSPGSAKLTSYTLAVRAPDDGDR